MLTIPLDGTTVLIAGVVALTLLLAIFAPQTLANLLGEPITLFGRLLGTIADWLQKGAEKLFTLVKSVFMIGKPVEKKAPTETTAQAIPAAPAGVTTPIQQQASIVEQPPAYSGVGSNGSSSRNGIHLPDSRPYGQLAPYEPETSPSITPYPDRNGGSSYSGSYSGAPSQHGDRVYGDPSYNGYSTNGNGYSTNGNGSRAMQPAAPNGVSANGTANGVATGQASGALSAPPDAAQPEEAEIHATWVGEVIISHVLYLVAGVIIVVSDFVFTVLRLQAVLFPDLPINPELANLSDLSGALFVSMVFLTGALTLDFLGVLPPPARLFPTMDDKKRRMFLALSLGAFLLNMAVVGVLFYAGQTLISYAASWPLGALIIATLIGVLQVLVMFLAAWGAIRGLSALLALSLGLVGIVLEFVAMLLTWIHEALRTVGEHLVPDLIFGFSGIFRPNPEHAPRPSSTTSNVLSIVGYGNTSSDFMAQLCADVTQLYTRSSLIAAGAYAEDYHTVDDVRHRLNRLGVNNIGTVGHEGAPLQTLRNNLIRAYHKHNDAQTTLLWIVDGEKLSECLGVFEELRRTLPKITISVVCFLPQTIRDQQPYHELARLSSPKQNAGNPPVALTVLIDRRSPLYRSLGDLHHDNALARGLAGMTLAPIHNPANQSFPTIIQNLNAAGYHFAALSVDSTGLVAARAQRRPGSWGMSEGLGDVLWQDALTRTQDLTQAMIENGVGSSLAQRLDLSRVPVYVNYLAPVPVRSHQYTQFRSGISSWLAERYRIEGLSIVQGSGVDLSDRHPEKHGDRHAQVCLLYGVPDSEVNRLLPEKAATQDADYYERSHAEGAMAYPSIEQEENRIGARDQNPTPDQATSRSRV
jgi:hypothetical protein